MNGQQLGLKKTIKYQSYHFLANINHFLVPNKVKKVVWVASYPRGGNTWFRKIIANLYGIDASNLGQGKEVSKIVPDFERRQTWQINQLTPCHVNQEKVYCFKTHQLPFPNYQLPIGEATEFINYGYIYLYRHPLDVFLSVINHAYYEENDKFFFDQMPHSVDELKESGKLDLYMQKYIEDLSIGNNTMKRMCGGTWLNHVNTWLSLHHSYENTSFIIRYEDLVEDTFSTLQPLARFLGKTDMELQTAIENAQKKTQKNGKFYWKQQPGNYVNYLSQETINKFLEKYQDSLQKLGY